MTTTGGRHTRRAGRLTWRVLALLATVAMPISAESIPTAVSPGDGSRLTVAPSACPAFSWTEVPDAQGYEIAVYQIGAENEAPRRVLKQRLPGGATSWTPSLGRCLARGEDYGWTVRALGAQGASEWSPPSLFKVAAGPSEAELEAALEVVRSYVDIRGRSPEPSTEAATPAAPASSTNAPIFGEDPAPLGTPPAGTQLTVDGNVHATSFSGDGSALSGVATTANLGTHAGDASAHHAPTVDTNCHGNPCDGSALTGLNADQLLTGTVLEPRIDAALARDDEITAALDNLDCIFPEVLVGVFPSGNPHCQEAIRPATSTWVGPGTLIGSSGPADTYPSTVNVDFSHGDVVEVDVVLNGLSHTRPDDLDILLVGPGGEAVLLMSDAGGENDISGFTLNFADRVPITAPDSGPLLDNASYSPTDHDPASDNFPAPAPAGPYGTSLSAFAGLDPVGDWKLYVRDDQAGEAGELSSWWVKLSSLPESVGAPAATDLAAHAADASAHHVPPTALPPTGMAGGHLTGTYPDPAFAQNSVSTSTILDGTIVEADLAFDPATQAELDAVAPTGECEGFAIAGRRFIDRGDGTVRDCDTGKIWLRDAGCMGSWPWADVGDTIFTKINELNSAVDFSCGDYVAGTYTDWEVPDIATLEGVVDSSIPGTPKVYNGPGDAAWTPGNVFLAIQGSLYWSATEVDPTDASCVGMNNGSTFSCVKTGSQHLWPVRSD